MSKNPLNVSNYRFSLCYLMLSYGCSKHPVHLGMHETTDSTATCNSAQQESDTQESLDCSICLNKFDPILSKLMSTNLCKNDKYSSFQEVGTSHYGCFGCLYRFLKAPETYARCPYCREKNKKVSLKKVQQIPLIAKFMKACKDGDFDLLMYLANTKCFVFDRALHKDVEKSLLVLSLDILEQFSSQEGFRTIISDLSSFVVHLLDQDTINQEQEMALDLIAAKVIDDTFIEKYQEHIQKFLKHKYNDPQICPNLRLADVSPNLFMGCSYSPYQYETITFLHLAAAKGWTGIVEELLSKDALDVTVTTPFEETALLLAVQAGHKDIVDLLLEHYKRKKLNLDHVDSCGNNILHRAIIAIHGHKVSASVRASEKFLSGSSTPNSHLGCGIPPMSQSSDNSNCTINNQPADKDRINSIVQFRHSIEKNFSDFTDPGLDSMHTQMHLICLKHSSLVASIFSDSADNSAEDTYILEKLLNSVDEKLLNAGNFNNETLLHLAVKYKLHNVLALLDKYQHRIDVNFKNNDGYTLLHRALIVDKDADNKILSRLLEWDNIDVNLCSNVDGLSPLHLAVLHALPDSVAQLLEAGANTEVMDKYNRTPLDYCDYLLQFGCMAHQVDQRTKLQSIQGLLQESDESSRKRSPNEYQEDCTLAKRSKLG